MARAPRKSIPHFPVEAVASRNVVQKPKLLFVSNLFPDHVENYRGLDNATLLHELAEQYDIRVISPRPGFLPRRRMSRDLDQIFEPVYLTARYLPKIGSRINHRFMARALRPAMKKLRRTFAFDVVLCSWVYPDGCAIAGLAREMNFPFVVVAQGTDVHQYLLMPARRCIIVESMREAKAVITRSRELAEMLGEAGVLRERLHTVYNGVDFSTFRPADIQVARREIGVPPDARMVLFVGNFYEIKNPLLLVEAVAELRREPALKNLLLVLLGGGPLEKKARRLAVTLGQQKDVRFAGRTNAAGVARYMQAADLFCLPSRHEGVPNVVLESFACGLPLVASHVGGIPEVLRHDFLGCLVVPNDRAALVSALRERLQRPVDVDAIAAYARGFSWGAAAAEYVAIIERARSKKPMTFVESAPGLGEAE